MSDKKNPKDFKTKINDIMKTDAAEKFLASFLAILSGLLLGFIIMIIVRPGASFGGFATILTGGFQQGTQSLGRVLHFSTPLILAGLSVAFAFKAGLFNIGATGQITMGGFVAIYIGVQWTWLPGPLHWIVAILGAMVMGAIWGAIPGLLKAYRNVHEVVATIMMNYIAMYLVQILIVATVYNENRNETRTVPVSARIPRFGLDVIFPRSNVTFGIILAIIAAIVIYIILYKTTLGYQLRMVGSNKDAAKYAGINEKRNIVYSMVIAGALAGLAGATIYLSPAGRHIEVVSFLLPEGFEGIAVALLGMSNPIGVIFAGLFFGYIKVGGFFMQSWGFEPEIIDIIIASIIYFSALSMVFRKRAVYILRKLLFKRDRGDDNEESVD
ncbi:MAG: ABC transporter permease [Candidatus Izemoplasmataceae bacterium]|jgi:general nucleoside transport system permease protein